MDNKTIMQRISPFDAAANGTIHTVDFQLYNEKILEQGLFNLNKIRYNTVVEGIAGRPIDLLVRRKDMEVICTGKSSWNHSCFFKMDEMYGYLSFDSHGELTAEFASSEMGDVFGNITKLLQKIYPPMEPVEGKVPFVLWTDTVHGPQSITRQLEVPGWKDIEGNYPTDVRNRLGHFINNYHPMGGGQLVLWNGVPGTGKTYAIRALSSAWEKWAKFEYITDPEKFFGEGTSYMVKVLMGEGEPDDDDLWRMFILEDAGELLTFDAREKVGQGLSRLLNIVDGLIGQGLKIMILITTNEELGKMHPAVTRPGRCAFQLEFEAFPTDQANKWLESHSAATNSPKTLAEMFAMVNEKSLNIIEEDRKIGFLA